MGSKANRPWLPLPRTRPATANRQFSPSTTIVSLSFHFETIILFECCTAASRNDPLLLPTWLLAGNYCLFSRPLETAQDFRNFRRVPPLFRAKCLVFLDFFLFFSPRFVYFSFGFQCVYRSRFVASFVLGFSSCCWGRSCWREVEENYEKQKLCLQSCLEFDVISLVNNFGYFGKWTFLTL